MKGQRMKLPKIVVASLCLMALTAAPALAENAAFGVEAGVTASRFSPNNPGESISLNPGALVGIFAVVPILKSVSFMPELVYVQKYAARSGTTLGSAKIEYVEVPLLAKMPFLWGTYFAEGIALGFPVNARGFAQNLSQTTSPDVSVVIGGGKDIGKFAIEFRYDGGVRQVSTRTNDSVQRTRSFMLFVRLHL